MKTLRRFLPINLNALILLLTSAYSISLIKHSDLLATIFAYSLIGLVLLMTILVITNFLILRKKLELGIITKSKSFIQYLDRPCYLKLEINNLQILPLCQVKISVDFESSNFSPPAVILKTKEPNLQTEYQVTFPHHAEWKVAKIKYAVSDIFGLAIITGTKDNHHISSFKVEPPRVFTPELPLVFSSLTAGDVLNLPQKKLGDYYDLKKYHPSDGIGKIVWKIFARNQELIARHPEETALPAGKSLVFLVGDKKSTALSRHCLNYLEQLTKKDLEFVFACSGKLPSIFNNIADATSLLLANVWSAKTQNWPSNLAQLQLLLAKEKTCLEIAIFIEDHNPIQRQLLNFCKIKNIKVLLITSQKAIKRTSKLSNFLFKNENAPSSLGPDKLISKYV